MVRLVLYLVTYCLLHVYVQLLLNLLQPVQNLLRGEQSAPCHAIPVRITFHHASLYDLLTKLYCIVLMYLGNACKKNKKTISKKPCIYILLHSGFNYVKVISEKVFLNMLSKGLVWRVACKVWCKVAASLARSKYLIQRFSIKPNEQTLANWLHNILNRRLRFFLVPNTVGEWRNRSDGQGQPFSGRWWWTAVLCLQVAVYSIRVRNTKRYCVATNFTVNLLREKQSILNRRLRKCLVPKAVGEWHKRSVVDQGTATLFNSTFGNNNYE